MGKNSGWVRAQVVLGSSVRESSEVGDSSVVSSAASVAVETHKPVGLVEAVLAHHGGGGLRGRRESASG